MATRGLMQLFECKECRWQGHFELIFNAAGTLIDTDPPLVCPSCGNHILATDVAVSPDGWKGVYGTTGGP